MTDEPRDETIVEARENTESTTRPPASDERRGSALTWARSRLESCTKGCPKGENVAAGKLCGPCRVARDILAMQEDFEELSDENQALRMSIDDSPEHDMQRYNMLLRGLSDLARIYGAYPDAKEGIDILDWRTGRPIGPPVAFRGGKMHSLIDRPKPRKKPKVKPASTFDLAEAFETSGMPQSALAEFLGMSDANVSRMASGFRPAKDEEVEKIKQFFDIVPRHVPVPLIRTLRTAPRRRDAVERILEICKSEGINLRRKPDVPDHGVIAILPDVRKGRKIPRADQVIELAMLAGIDLMDLLGKGDGSDMAT